MTEEWKDKFRDALDGFEMTPSGISIDDIITRSKAAKAVPFWKRNGMGIAVAAILSAAAAVAIFVLGRTEKATPMQKVLLADSSTEIIPEPIQSPKALTDRMSSAMGAPSTTATQQQADDAASVDAPPISVSQETGPQEAETEQSTPTEDNAKARAIDDATTNATDGEDSHGQEKTSTEGQTIPMEEWLERQTKERRRGKLKLCLDAGGMPILSSSSASSYDMFADPGADVTNGKEGTDDEATSTKAEDAPTVGQSSIDDDAEHEAPLKIGVTVSLPLTDRLSLVSGVIYSHQRSSIDRQVGAAQRYSLTQTLDYVGIPLGLEYEFWSPGRFSVSAYGGMAVEKMIRGRRWQDGQESNSRQKVSMGSLQWSASASVVLEYDLTDFLGIYLQPGVGFYFDNGSSLTNYYGDNPISPDIRLGLRFTIPR